MIGLTRRQSDCLGFIKKYLAEKGIPPSYDEMLVHLGLTGKSGIHRIITALEERGLIRRMPNRARAIEVLDASNNHLYFVDSNTLEWLRYGAERRVIPVETLIGEICSQWAREESTRTRRPVERITA